MFLSLGTLARLHANLPLFTFYIAFIEHASTNLLPSRVGFTKENSWPPPIDRATTIHPNLSKFDKPNKTSSLSFQGPFPSFQGPFPYISLHSNHFQRKCPSTAQKDSSTAQHPNRPSLFTVPHFLFACTLAIVQEVVSKLLSHIFYTSQRISYQYPEIFPSHPCLQNAIQALLHLNRKGK